MLAKLTPVQREWYDGVLTQFRRATTKHEQDRLAATMKEKLELLEQQHDGEDHEDVAWVLNTIAACFKNKHRPGFFDYARRAYEMLKRMFGRAPNEALITSAFNIGAHDYGRGRKPTPPPSGADRDLRICSRSTMQTELWSPHTHTGSASESPHAGFCRWRTVKSACLSLKSSQHTYH